MKLLQYIKLILGTLGAACVLASCRAESDTQSIGTGTADGAGSAIHGVGYVEPAGEVRRLVFRYPGIVAEVVVEEGQQVDKGALLLRLRCAEEESQLVIARAALAEAQADLKRVLAGAHPARIEAARAAQSAASADLEHRKTDLSRQNELIATKATTSANLDTARSLHDQAVAILAAAAAELDYLVHFTRTEDLALAEARQRVAAGKVEAAEATLSESQLRAPMAGRVLDVLARPGDATSGANGEAVCLLGDTSQLVVRAEIDENYALRVAPGQTAEVVMPGLRGETMRGTVVDIKPLMGRKTVFSRSATERRDLDVRQVLIQLDPGTDLPIGLKVDVRIDVGKKRKVEQ